MSNTGTHISTAEDAIAWLHSCDYDRLTHQAESVVGSFDGDPNFAQDCVNKGITHLLEHPEKLVGKNVNDAFLLTVVCNFARMFVRASKGRREELPDELPAVATDDNQPEGEAMEHVPPAVEL
jgi:DNA-directed RNA polymerase specialized sigma24 family protein